MKRGFWILVLSVMVGIIAFVIARHSGGHITTHTITHERNTRLPELEWLRTELELSDEQYAKVTDLHHAYQPTCEELCMRVIASHQKIKVLVEAGNQVSPELESALKEHALIHVECQSAMLKHIYKTAACMSSNQAKTYLNVMVPHVIELPMEPEPTHQ